MPRRPRCSLIEEWWINVHAFDLAGGVLSNRVPLFQANHPCSPFLSPFCILCACYRHERLHVVRAAFTPRGRFLDVPLDASSFSTNNHYALVSANRKCVSLSLSPSFPFFLFLPRRCLYSNKSNLFFSNLFSNLFHQIYLALFLFFFSFFSTLVHLRQK